MQFNLHSDTINLCREEEAAKRDREKASAREAQWDRSRVCINFWPLWRFIVVVARLWRAEKSADFISLDSV